MKKIKFIVIVSLLLSLTCFGQRVNPYVGSRIFWDFDSQTTIFSPGNYSRMIQLQDGRLMAVAEALGGISASYSSNKGSSWSTPQLIAPGQDSISSAVPDVIQLTDGTILVGINPRPSKPYTNTRLFGIRVIRSTDNGKSWSNPYYIYDAKSIFTDGCWEPSFLELPSGEVQCYFANESDFTTNNDQNISMCRSFDKGITWSSPVTVCYRAGSRDGMPVPVLLNNPDEIVVIIEDSGWPGRVSFAATTVRSTLQNNWMAGYVNASSSDREMIFETTPASSLISAAPYLRKLPSGETVASFQSNENRVSNDLQYFDMYVMVGDDRAQNFKAKSAPFSLGNDKHSIWNSVSVIDTGIVVALGSIGIPNGRNDVVMIKGYPISQAKANYGTITIDGVRSSTEKWTSPTASQFFLGATTGNKAKVDFLYDDNFVYMTALVIDRTLISTGTDNDGIRFLIDANDVSTSTPQMGMYNFFFDTNGTVKFSEGNNGNWVTSTNTSGIKYSVTVNSFYYLLEAAIPWNLLGKTSPPLNSRMAIAVENIDKQQYTIKYNKIADVDNNASWTWLNFKLIEPEKTEVASVQKKNEIISTVKNNILYIESSVPIIHLSFYSFMGQLIESKKGMDYKAQVPLQNQHGGILNLYFEDGSFVRRKIII